ncbi:YjcZ family sporulation protein [Bacillus sp. J37]|nr:YjcZ family sporulation protein [Bacillus sp. J37]
MHYYDFGTYDGCGYYDYGFAAPVSYGNGFSLIVVLFILLIIVGTVYFGY